LKLFLDQFQIRSCVLNSELPVNIRCHTVLQFNQSIYDILIASDDRALINQTKKASAKDKEFGVSRGIDFQNISNVVNFDFPLDTNSYMHRAGRTARGNNSGNVLSLVSVDEKTVLDQVNALLNAHQPDESIIKEYQLEMKDVEAFRYRARDAWRAIIKTSIRDARLKEIKTELFNSEKLKGYFDENPRDLQVLRHDRMLHSVKTPKYLSDVPEYIVPNALKHVAGIIDVPRRSKRPASDTKTKYDHKKEDALKCASIDYHKKKRFIK
jgi:ATP-dependent RNA helicase DDX56/DBP9